MGRHASEPGSTTVSSATVSRTTSSSETSSKSERAYVAIKEKILCGEYTPGYRLVLAKLADDLGFSVVPVREAIRRLEAENFVTFERNVGAPRWPGSTPPSICTRCRP